ncbi:ATP-binding protein [Microvirga sp. 17 mud 1-3]|uniref:ATP-binding protein n=1 Tax=Microvirga sp. 17 mud 1-3 TaxID=2082949 RepID=UPI000D6AF6B9|nr:ATP-binding protein [Microvirga sp. 17 mud 1-3]AWM88251.1 two-component sensor histidine kinase [Microvirga sp. 17 mud 1-3]
MSEPDETRKPSGLGGLGPERSAALGGALVVGATILVATAVRGHADIWLLAIAVVTAIFATLVLGRPRAMRDGERLKAKEARHSNLAEAVLAHIPDPVILVDQRSLVVEANKAARAMLPGLKTSHPLSFALRSPDILDGIEGALSGEGPLKVEYSERVPTERTFEVHIGLLRGNPADLGGRSGVVLFFRDLTSTRRLEAMRADFVANASHELRTPLASLLGFVETLQGPARNDAAARERFLEIMREQAQRMKRLIDNLLSLSRIEMRAHVPPTEPVDLKAVTTHMIEMLTPLAQERGTLIQARLPDRPLVVPGDRDELLRVCENLIENAVKYGESGGRVEVELSRTESPDGKPLAVLAVQDYGPGIPPEHLPRLTERFYRVDGAQSRDKGGTGLGLAIVKHIVNRHRGRFDIASEPGQGARFTITLPASAET